MRTFAVLVGKELTEQWRTMRLPSAVAVFLFPGIGSPLFARYTPHIVSAIAGPELAAVIPPPGVAEAVAQFVRNMGQLGALLAVVLAMGSVAVAGLATYACTALLFSALGPGFLVTCVLALVALLVFTAVTFAPSTVTGSTIAGGGAGLGSIVLSGALPAFPRVGCGAVAPILWPLAAPAALAAGLFTLSVVVFHRQEL